MTDSVKKIFNDAIQFADELKLAFNQKNIKEGELYGFRSLIFTALDQAQSYAKAIRILCMKNHEHESLPIIRTFFEFYISIKLIHADQELTQRFAAFSWVRKKKMIDNLEKHSAMPGSDAGHGLTKDDIDTAYEEAMSEFNFTDANYWYKPIISSLRDACVETGDEFNYDIMYRYLSDVSHANIVTFSPYKFKEEAEGLTFSREEDQDHSRAYASSSLLLTICNIFNNEFDLGLESKIEAFSRRMEAMKR